MLHILLEAMCMQQRRRRVVRESGERDSKGSGGIEGERKGRSYQ